MRLPLHFVPRRRFPWPEESIESCAHTFNVPLYSSAALVSLSLCSPFPLPLLAPLPSRPPLLPLTPQLWAALDSSAAYPIPPGTALVSTNLQIVRQPGTYTLCPSIGSLSVITAAMPCGIADRRPKGGWAGSPWVGRFRLWVRSVGFGRNMLRSTCRHPPMYPSGGVQLRQPEQEKDIDGVRAYGIQWGGGGARGLQRG